MKFLIVTIFVFLGVPWVAADCFIPAPEHPTAIVVQQCAIVEPPQYKEIREFSRKHWEVYDAYRGAVINYEMDGVASRIFYPSTDDRACDKFLNGSEVSTFVQMACCDGDPNPPCLLGFAEYFRDVDVPGNSPEAARSDAAPDEAAPSKTVPTKEELLDTAPREAAPSDARPTEAELQDTAPGGAAPSDRAPSDD